MNKPTGYTTAFIIFIVLTTFGFSLPLHSQETPATGNSQPQSPEQQLAALIAGNQWDQLPQLVTDKSHEKISQYFADLQSIKITPSPQGWMVYKAKFPQKGEIGVLTYEKKDGKFLKLTVKNQIKPLHFVQYFRTYNVSNLTITAGDARITFKQGTLYQALPFDSFFLFDGNWSFHITPNDEEEKLTLKRRFKRQNFTRNLKTGIFLLEEQEFINRLTPAGRIQTAGENLRRLLPHFKNRYGVQVEEYGEYWYLPFPRGTCMAVFPKGRKEAYYYLYNENTVPDTRLTDSDTQKLLLNYNAHKGIKLRFGKANRVQRLDLNIYYNPENNFLSGTTALQYENPTNIKEVLLAPGLQLVKNLDSGSAGFNVFRKGERYYLMGSMDKKLSWYFKGAVTAGGEELELFKHPEDAVGEIPGTENDRFYYLSSTRNFYPNPGESFFNAQVTVRLPAGLSCLGSGNRSIAESGDISSYTFAHPGAHGFSLAVGNFSPVGVEKARIPVHFHAFDSVPFPGGLETGEIARAVDFFIDRFGPLELDKLHVLLKMAPLAGGISNTGFMVINLLPGSGPRSRTQNISLEPAPGAKKILSPVQLRDRPEDHIIHEIAHQWWGGRIAWKTYRDVWLTEGLTHFSVLYFLKQQLSPREFSRVLKRVRRWVYRHGDTGPIIYGTRLHMLEERYEAYQSIVYNKTALVFFMLMDMMGEKEFLKRLRSTLKKFDYQGVSSEQFIRQFSGNNNRIKNFFKFWIYNRTLPTVELSLAENDKAYDKKKFKTIVLKVTQQGTPGIFPLQLNVSSRGKSSTEHVVMTQREQKFTIKRNARIRTIDVAENFYLVKEKKQPPKGRY